MSAATMAWKVCPEQGHLLRSSVGAFHLQMVHKVDDKVLETLHNITENTKGLATVVAGSTLALGILVGVLFLRRGR